MELKLAMPQKRILIVSYPYDIHARAVAYAIRARGHFCEEFYCADYPTLNSITLRASNQKGNVSSGSVAHHPDGSFKIQSDTFNTVWLRRRRDPWLPASMHPGDREVAISQCDLCLSDFMAALDGPDVFWINPVESNCTSDLKLYQLRHALAAGLKIPDTLISNDPDEIREFINRCGGRAIHKLLQNITWKSEDGAKTFACCTTPVSCQDLPRDAVLRLSPGIFQPLIDKQFEVRVACFGNHLMAVQIDSQSDERARLDWRMGQWFVEMKPYDLPEEIAEKIRRFLHTTGLAYAALDFIVTPDGEHVFLESNPQGQFLWMEDRAGLPVLDVFSQYLIAGDKDFRPELSDPQVTWPQFRAVWEGGLKESVHRHVLVEEAVSVPDYIS
jgi:glutathione synthase/RimK-type ligase-like ATP-grasp enzyme